MKYACETCEHSGKCDVEGFATKKIWERKINMTYADLIWHQLVGPIDYRVCEEVIVRMSDDLSSWNVVLFPEKTVSQIKVVSEGVLAEDDIKLSLDIQSWQMYSRESLNEMRSEVSNGK